MSRVQIVLAIRPLFGTVHIELEVHSRRFLPAIASLPHHKLHFDATLDGIVP